MSMNFKWDKSGESNILFLSGVIDEHSDFSSIGPIGDSKDIMLDLKNIERLNSIGIKSWMIWIKSLSGKLILRNCPLTFVYHMNVLTGFIPEGTHIESFEVPYVCSDCGHEETVLAVVDKDFRVSKAEMQLAPDRTCTECGSLSQLDAVPSLYFQFLKRAG